MSQHQSRKHFLAKALGLTAAAVAIPRAFAKRATANPVAPVAPVTLAVESRAIARRNDSL